MSGSERPTDHRNLNLAQLHRDVVRGTSGGRIIWQPRILSWHADRVFDGRELPGDLAGEDLPGIYRKLGCSNRIYDYNACIERVEDQRIRRYDREVAERRTEHVVETPVGTLTSIEMATDSNPGVFPEKWWVCGENDLKVAQWIQEHTDWRWNEEHYRRTYAEWGDLGLPTVFMPRVNVQHLYVNDMGVEAAVYAMTDCRTAVGKYFAALDECHDRYIEVVNPSRIDVINFGDNVHCGLLPPELFLQYVRPAYQRRCERLHRAGKFVHTHWDGDVKAILPFARDCGLDGIEAITPKPQGDVTLEEVKDALGDDLFLLDGIAAILFDDTYPEEELIAQAQLVIELFAPKLILGISDEMPSTGSMDRVRLVGRIVDDYNAQQCIVE